MVTGRELQGIHYSIVSKALHGRTGCENTIMLKKPAAPGLRRDGPDFPPQERSLQAAVSVNAAVG